MKFLFAITHLNFWYPLECVALELCSQNQQVRLLLDKRRHGKWADRYSFDPNKKPYSVGWMRPRIDLYSPLLKTTRTYLNYAAYLGIRQPTSPLLTERARKSTPKLTRLFTRFGKVRNWLHSNHGWETLHNIEVVIPPSRLILSEIARYNPDILIASSAVLGYARETDYLKAASRLGIRTAVVIPSWDNLTTKGTLHAIPDWLFVWNERQVDEAVQLHNVPRERIFCTGAPKYDPWFNLEPALDREDFCQALGIDSARSFLLYVCSSLFISGDETIFVDELSTRLRQNLKLSDLILLIRPHPQNLEYWQRYQKKNDNVFMWPKDLLNLEPSAMMQDYYHSIYYSSGVVGINTSAFIESAIVDRPCIAILSDRYNYTQMGLPHFHHLADAGFLELPRDLDEATTKIAGILDGIDSKAKKRRRFVKDFLRPQGLAKPASEVMHNAIKNVASGLPPGNCLRM